MVFFFWNYHIWYYWEEKAFRWFIKKKKKRSADDKVVCLQERIALSFYFLEAPCVKDNFFNHFIYSILRCLFHLYSIFICFLIICEYIMNNKASYHELKKFRIVELSSSWFSICHKITRSWKGTKVLVSKISKDQNQIFLLHFNLSFLPPKRKDQKRRPIKLQS